MDNKKTLIDACNDVKYSFIELNIEILKQIKDFFIGIKYFFIFWKEINKRMKKDV